MKKPGHTHYWRLEDQKPAADGVCVCGATAHWTGGMDRAPSVPWQKTAPHVGEPGRSAVSKRRGASRWKSQKLRPQAE